MVWYLIGVAEIDVDFRLDIGVLGLYLIGSDEANDISFLCDATISLTVVFSHGRGVESIA